MARPRVYDAATHRELVRVAGELLAARGPAALSVRAVADAADVSTRAIYALFGSKAELVRAMYVAGFEELDAALHAVVTTSDPSEDLLELGLAYRHSALSEPQLYAVMFGTPFPEFVPGEADTALALGTLDVLRRAVHRAAPVQGWSAGDDLEDITIGLWAAVHGLASLELTGALADRGEAFWRQQLGALVRGYHRGGGPTGRINAPG